MSFRIKFPYSWVGHIPFAQYLVNELKPNVIVELGTHSGNSFCSFIYSAKKYSPLTRVYAIDLWEGDEQAGFYSEDIYRELKNFLNNYYPEYGSLIRKDFNEAVNEFKNNTIDILHIDGLHTYEAVKNDFFTWKPKVKNDGIILFHDINVIQDGFGVDKFWRELKIDYAYYFEFPHSNGLGVLSLSSTGCDFIEKLYKDKFLIDSLINYGDTLLERELIKREYEINIPKLSIYNNSRYFKLRKFINDKFGF